MTKPTPEQNKNNVQNGDTWRDNKTGIKFVVRDIVHEDGVWFAKVVRSGSGKGLDTDIRLARLKSRKKANATSGYTLIERGKERDAVAVTGVVALAGVPVNVVNGIVTSFAETNTETNTETADEDVIGVVPTIDLTAEFESDVDGVA